MAASKRAQELAAELMRIEDRLPKPVPSYDFSGHHYSGTKLTAAKKWLATKYNKNPKLYMIGGISVVVAAVAVIAFAAYRKKKESAAQ
jgi:hypothetical protein